MSQRREYNPLLHKAKNLECININVVMPSLYGTLVPLARTIPSESHLFFIGNLSRAEIVPIEVYWWVMEK
jgi:hypothetical protein